MFYGSLWLQATCRFRDLSFPHGGFWPLEDANRGDVADDGGAASAAAAVFAAAPFVEDTARVHSSFVEEGNSPCKLVKLVNSHCQERELKQLDVPDENLVELRSEEEVVEKELKSWLIQDTC